MLVAERSLHALADQLRADDSVISPYVTDPDSDSPALGMLAAAGRGAAVDPGEYALLIEAIREGYLLHYGTPRLVAGADHDLALLAGDYLYARGLERLAALGDLESVRELSDLISLSAQLHAEEQGGRSTELWLASVTAVATGPSTAHQEAKAALRRAEDRAHAALWLQAVRSARGGGYRRSPEARSRVDRLRAPLGPLPEAWPTPPTRRTVPPATAPSRSPIRPATSRANP